MKRFIAFALLVSAPLSAYATEAQRVDTLQCFSANGTLLIDGKFTNISVNWSNGGPAAYITATNQAGMFVAMTCAYFIQTLGILP